MEYEWISVLEGRKEKGFSHLAGMWTRSLALYVRVSLSFNYCMQANVTLMMSLTYCIRTKSLLDSQDSQLDWESTLVQLILMSFNLDFVTSDFICLRGMPHN